MDQVKVASPREAIAREIAFLREYYNKRCLFSYSLQGTVAAGTMLVQTVTTEQGSDFQCRWITGSAFYYDSSERNTAPSWFPVPQGVGSMNQWAVRGLQLYIKDSRAGRDLTAGYVPFELLCAPGYGYMLQAPQALRYLFMRNSQIEVRVRNIDRVAQKFALVFTGEKRYCSTEEGGQK